MPVTSDLIQIIFQDEDIVVVNKPASIPVSNYFKLILIRSCHFHFMFFLNPFSIVCFLKVTELKIHHY